jgi:hypothetical protein
MINLVRTGQSADKGRNPGSAGSRGKDQSAEEAAWLERDRQDVRDTWR